MLYEEYTKELRIKLYSQLYTQLIEKDEQVKFISSLQSMGKSESGKQYTYDYNDFCQIIGMDNEYVKKIWEEGLKEDGNQFYIKLKLMESFPLLFIHVTDNYIFKGGADQYENMTIYFNHYYKKIVFGGKCVVMFDDDLTKTYAPNEFYAMNTGKKYINEDGKEFEAAKLWFKTAPVFNDVGFYPHGEEKTGRFNLFKPFLDGSEKKIEMAHKFLDFIKEIICKGNERRNDYLLDWLAQIYQEPENKTGVGIAFTLRGQKGVGKSFFAKNISRIYGERQSISVNSVNSICGDFNGILYNKIFIIAEEAVWGGDKHEISKLKDMITNDTTELKFKFKESVIINNYFRFMFLTNADWTPGERGERRFYTLDVSDQHIKDSKYFSELQESLNSGGLEGFAYILANRDYSKRDWQKDFEITEAMKESIQKAGDSVEKWVENCLLEKSCETGEEQLGILYDEYLDYCSKMGHYKEEKNVFARKLRKILPSLQWNKRGAEKINMVVFPGCNLLQQDLKSYLFN